MEWNCQLRRPHRETFSSRRSSITYWRSTSSASAKSSSVSRGIDNFSTSGSSSARIVKSSSMSFGESAVTTAPRFGTIEIRPSASSCRNASRTGIRLTWNCAAIASCRSCELSGNSPLMICSRNLSATADASDNRGMPSPSVAPDPIFIAPPQNSSAIYHATCASPPDAQRAKAAKYLIGISPHQCCLRISRRSPRNARREIACNERLDTVYTFRPLTWRGCQPVPKRLHHSELQYCVHPIGAAIAMKSSHLPAFGTCGSGHQIANENRGSSRWKE